MLYFALGVIAVGLAIWFLIWGGQDPAKIKPDEFEFDIAAASEKQRKVTDTREKFLVIGVGFSGLGICGSLARNGIPFDAVEKEDKVGGNWYSGVYNHVHILSSKATTEFKDFPMPKDYPEFPSGKQMCAYLQSYAVHYNLLERITFKRSVVSAVPHKEESGSYKDKELWKVTFDDGQVRIYKGILSCIGHHWSKRIPSYPGQETFKGLMIHSKDFKSPDIFVDKRVLVVGGGNSACDINVEAARVASESHSSLRRGYWFFPRTIFGIPFVEMVYPWMPLWFQRFILRAMLSLIIGDPSRYGLQKPDHKIFELHPTINSEYLNYVKLGVIKPHPDIKQFNGNTVQFKDGTKIEVDVVVFATGYNHSLPFFSPEVLQYNRGVPSLVAGLFHPTFKNLYVMGIFQPRYGAGPLITLGGETLAKTILIQDKLKTSVGRILLNLGEKLSTRNNSENSLRVDILGDPHSLCQKTRLMMRVIPYLPTIENVLLTIGIKV